MPIRHNPPDGAPGSSAAPLHTPVKFRRNLFPTSAGRTLHRMSRYKRLYVIAVAVFLLDQVTKTWIYFAVAFATDRIEVIPGFFYIVHWGNTGAAWGILQGMSYWLALLAVIALAAIFKLRHHLSLRTPAAQTCFGFLCGGIVGNLVDRIVHGYVIDFLDLRFGQFAWPAFNVADSAICIGVGLYIFYSFVQPDKLDPPHP